MEPFIVYNNTSDDIIIQTQTIPANGSFSVSPSSVVAWAKDPQFVIAIIASKVGVNIYGTDLGYGIGSVADQWILRIAQGAIAF